MTNEENIIRCVSPGCTNQIPEEIFWNAQWGHTPHGPVCPEDDPGEWSALRIQVYCDGCNAHEVGDGIAYGRMPYHQKLEVARFRLNKYEGWTYKNGADLCSVCTRRGIVPADKFDDPGEVVVSVRYIVDALSAAMTHIDCDPGCTGICGKDWKRRVETSPREIAEILYEIMRENS